MTYLRSTILAAAAALILAAPVTAAAQTVFVVNSQGDTGDTNPGNGVCAAFVTNLCTLRAAIQEANAFPGTDTIQFAIGSGPKTISLTSTLPPVTQPVTIDGWTQPGFSGSPTIDINGSGQGGLVIAGGGTVVRGFVLRNFSSHVLVLTVGDGNVVAGNYFGLTLSGVSPSPNSAYAIVVTNSSNNRIGGTAAVQRNVIAKSMGTGDGGGIVLHAGAGNVVQGNLIGTDVNGTIAQPNVASGITIVDSSSNVIGGPQPGATNVISGNRGAAVRIAGTSNDNVVQGNLIGVNSAVSTIVQNVRGVEIHAGTNNRVLGNLIAGNAYDGVLIAGATNSLIDGNIIAYNGYGPVEDPEQAGYFGVWVTSGTGNQITSNQIFGNYHLGINLNADLVTPNDLADADGGANNSQNHPTMLGADRFGSVTVLTGSLASTPNTTFRLQFFVNPTCDSPGVGEGQVFLGETTIATNAAGGGAWSFVYNGLLPVGYAVSGTATSAAGNTSEFAPCRGVR
jgi:CSLREA domain-containing protein